MRLSKLLISALWALAAAAGPAQAHEYYTRTFTLIHPWARATQPDQTDAPVYFSTVEVEEGDRLLRAFSPLAEAVVIESGQQDGQGQPFIEIRAGDGERFFEGGPHLLLRGLKQPLNWGLSYPMVLIFEKSGMINVTVSVGTH